MCTSPLKRPARRMCPAPSILPSIVMSEAMIDSAGSPRCTLRRTELETGDGVGMESSDVSVCLNADSEDEAGEGGGLIGAASFLGDVASFQIAIARCSFGVRY